MKNRNLVALLLALLAAAAISACGGGGGGGGGGTPPPATTYTISGTVTSATGTVIPGVRITLSTGPVATTDSAGKYSFSGLANGPYTLTPSLAGYVFNPSSTIRTVTSANITGVNFIATPSGSTHSISGTITASSVGLPGVTVSLFGTSVTTTTNGSGAYTFANLGDGPYTVTPNLTGYTFSPVSSSLTLAGANATNVNFTATTVADPTKAVVKFSTSSTTTLIGAIDIVVALPAGASLKTASPPTVDLGSAYASGNAASSALFLATYSSTSNTMHGLLGSLSGFSSGEFMTIVADLSGGIRPTASEFVVQSLVVTGLAGSSTPVLPGVTASASVTLSGGGIPTKGRLKLSTSGTTTTITGVDVTIKLPVGVSVNNMASPPATDPGVVFASGNAIANSFTAGNYDSINRTLHIGLINMYGFAAGEFATVLCDLSGVSPLSTDFQIQSATLYGLYSSTSITGTVDRAVTLE